MRRSSSGRYLVANKQFPNQAAAVAYAMSKATDPNGPATLYVRVIGEPRPVRAAERVNDRLVILHRIGD